MGTTPAVPVPSFDLASERDQLPAEADLDSLCTYLDSHAGISEVNVKFIKGLVTHTPGRSLPESVRNAHCRRLIPIAAALGDTTFFDVTGDQLLALLAHFERELAAPPVADRYKYSLRRVYSAQLQRTAKKVAPITHPAARLDVPDPPPVLLGKRDVRGLMGVASTARDIVLLATLWDAGLRLFQLTGLTTANVMPGAQALRISETPTGGPRLIELADAIPYLRCWVDAHPADERPAPLWPQADAPMQALTEPGIRSVIQRIRERAEFEQLSPQTFRISSVIRTRNEGAGYDAIRTRFTYSDASSAPAQYAPHANEYRLASETPLRATVPRADLPTTLQLGPRVKPCPQCHARLARLASRCPHCGADYLAHLAESEHDTSETPRG